MNENNNGLKPCPFCGAEESPTMRGYGGCWQVRCQACLAQSRYEVTENCAADIWNARPLESRVDPKEGRLYAALMALVVTLTEQDDEGLVEFAQPMIEARAVLSQVRGEAQEGGEE